MKWKIACCLAGALLITSCIPSLQPLYTEDTAVEVNRVVGEWTFDGGELSGLQQWCFDPVDGKSYDLVIAYHDSPAKPKEVFEVYFIELGERLFADFYLKHDPEENNALAPLIRTHGFARVEFEEGKMKISQFNIEWLMELFEQRKIRLAHQILDKENPEESLVLTATTRELQAFVTKYGGDDNAYGDPMFLEAVQ